MKKLVLVVAMFMFVCGGSFLVKAQSSAEAVTAPTGINATVVIVCRRIVSTLQKKAIPTFVYSGDGFFIK